MTIRTITVELAARTSGYVSNLKQAGRATLEFSGELQTLSKTSKEKFGDVTKFSLGAGLALTAFAGSVVKAGYTFDKTMSNVQAVAGANTKQLVQLRDAAIEAGKATQYSASQAATGEAELLKAGVSVTDVLHGGLTGALALAASGQIDLGAAATDTAQALNIFHLQGTAAGHVADLLSAGANKSATDVQHLSDSLNQVGLVSHQTGLSIEDTVGTLSLFAQNGLVGSDAGTSFKVMLQALQAPSDKTAGLMKSLGIEAYDTSGKFIGITAVAQNLHDKLSVLTQAQRDNALAQIFGNDGVRSATILYNSGAAGLQKWITGVNDSGAAARNAKTQMNNLAGDVEQLKGSLETFAITGSGGATKALRLLTEGSTGLINELIQLPTPITEAGTLLSGILGVGTLAATGFVKAKAGGDKFLTTLKEMGPAGEKAATLVGRVGSIAGKAGVWGAGILVAYEGVRALGDYVIKNGEPVGHDIDKLTDAIAKFGQTGEVTGELSKVAGQSLQTMAANFSQAVTAINKFRAPQTLQDFATSALKVNPDLANQQIVAMYQAQQQAAEMAGKDAFQKFADSDTSLANLVKNGDTADALKFYTASSNALQTQGYSMKQVNSLFPQYLDAAGNAATANAIAASSTNSLVTAQGTLITSMSDAISKGVALADVMDSLSGANESYEKSNIAAKQSLSDLQTQLKENDKNHVKNRKSLDDSTQAGRNNLNGILATIDADKQVFQQLYAKKAATEGTTAALQDASDEYKTYISNLSAALIKEGFNATQVNDLLNLYAQIPPVKATDVQVTGLDKAANAAQHLYDKVTALDGKTIHVGVGISLSGANKNMFLGMANRTGGVYTHAATGALRDANVYSAVNSGARYAFAEPGTGGEAFVPKYGNYSKSTQIIDTAAKWYGGRFAPAGGSGAGASHTTYAPTINNNVYPRQSNWSIHDQMAMQAAAEARMRVGRAF